MPVPHRIFLAVAATAAVTIARLAPSTMPLTSVLFLAISLYLVQCVCFGIWAVVLYPKLFSPLRHLPSPSGGNFFMGHFGKILKEPTAWPHREWLRTVPNDGIIKYHSFWNYERIFVTNPKGYAEVLSTKSYDFKKPPMMTENLGRILGHGILFAEGDEHKRQRKNLNPAFAFRHVKDLYPVFWAKSQEMVRGISTEISAKSTEATAEGEGSEPIVDVASWGNRGTLDIIGSAGLSQSFNALQDPTNDLFTTYSRLFKPSKMGRAVGMLGLIFPFWIIKMIPMQRNVDIMYASSFIRQKCRDMVTAKKAELAATPASEKEDGKHNIDILSVALRSGGFTDAELADQLMTFLAAGHETTATAFSWAVLLLCEHPDVQTRLREALTAANLPSASDTASSISSAQIEEIPYLSAFCNEVLRIYPPVPFTLRVTARATTILGQAIPKDTTVVLPPLAVNQDKELWGADADKFNPSRFMPPSPAEQQDPSYNAARRSKWAAGGADSNYAFMTFLHGPRSCIGQAFAKAEFACLVAAFAQAFEVRPTWAVGKEIDVEGSGVTMKPKNGVLVKLTPTEA